MGLEEEEEMAAWHWSKKAEAVPDWELGGYHAKAYH
jgi:hypothetical protein